MWPEDGEVWFYHDIKQQRQRFIRSIPFHSHDSAKHKQMLTAGSEQHEITQLTINNHNHQENQREVEHKLLKPQVQNRKQQQRHSWLQKPTQTAVEQQSTKQSSVLGGRLLRRLILSIAGDSEHLIQLIVAIIRVGIKVRHAKQDGGLFGYTNIEDTSGHWDWLWPYMVP
ncbi:unnamed protein product [Didymodactylos carnosus]|uniref:Uncharacterized protein n=1 Tax=Didymodactylos carnosus TaxID=1234261 RepID=A0A8S2DYI4_9BILA|nr:unnamed protein product [Didymodactylos carnosus]CAF3833256.1 unnamed protein product [Didymodactylos carnosus]